MAKTNMVKRKVGERAEILLDSIDLEILKKIKSGYGINGGYDGIGVLELANILNIKHNSLKPHLDKLMFLNLIFSYKNSQNKVMLGCGMENIKELSEFEFDSKKEYEEALKEAEHQQTLIKYLEKIKTYYHEKEMKNLIDFDLRKKNDLPKQINYTKELERLKRNGEIAKKLMNTKYKNNFVSRIKESKNDTNAPKPNNSKHKKVNKK
jgi:hypothetical protein